MIRRTNAIRAADADNFLLSNTVSHLKSPWSPHLPLAPEARAYRSWLTERSSLTARWQRASGAFRVEPVRQELASPLADEHARLALPSRRQAWIREVVLYCGATPVAFAHTAVPATPHGPVQHWLRRLGKHSLGTLLFSHPGFVRIAVDYAAIDRHHPLHTRLLTHIASEGRGRSRYWARRTLFACGRQRVLVTEVFLSAVLKY